MTEEQKTLFVLGIGAITLALILLWAFVAMIRRWRNPKVKPLTPDEQYETSRLESIQMAVREAQDEVTQLERTRTGLEQTIGQKRADIVALTQQFDQVNKRLTEVKEQSDKVVTQCYQCKGIVIGVHRQACGLRQKCMVLPYVKTPWTDVNKYLHSISEWGDPSEIENEILVPWPMKDSVKFTVGGIVYEWGKMEDEHEGGNYWWSFLTYTHPILEEITIINKVNSDGDHLYRDGYNDEEDLGGGDLGEIRGDVAKAIRQGLTALYLWMQNEKVS